MGQTPHTDTANFTPTRDSVYGILDKIAKQDIDRVAYADPIADVFETEKITNGNYIEDVIMEQAKDGTTFVPAPLDSKDMSNLMASFKVEDYDLKKIRKKSYFIGYGNDDFRRWLMTGKSAEDIKNMATTQLAEKRNYEKAVELNNAVQNTEKTVQSSAVNTTLEAYTAGVSTLKDIIFNIQQIVNATGENGSSTRVANLVGKTPRDRVQVFMSETLYNLLANYCKSGVYNLDQLTENYSVTLLPDYTLKKTINTSSVTSSTTDWNDDGVKYGGSSGKVKCMYNAGGSDVALTPSSNTLTIDNTFTVYIMDKRHIKPVEIYDSMFAENRRGQDDVVVGIYDRSGVFVSGLYSSVVLDCSAWKALRA